MNTGTKPSPRSSTLRPKNRAAVILVSVLAISLLYFLVGSPHFYERFLGSYTEKGGFGFLAPSLYHFAVTLVLFFLLPVAIIKNLLTFSRQDQVPMRKTDLNHEIERAMALVNYLVDQSDIRIIKNLAPDLPLIMANGLQIQQVVTNVVHNAIKFTPPGGRVDVFATRWDPQTGGSWTPSSLDQAPDVLSSGEWVQIKVEDSGVGIPIEDLPRVFERFYKADRARSGGGTGLGLSIAKHIVQAHDGYIWAQSVEGEGAVFTVVLPVLTPH